LAISFCPTVPNRAFSGRDERACTALQRLVHSRIAFLTVAAYAVAYGLVRIDKPTGAAVVVTLAVALAVIEALLAFLQILFTLASMTADKAAFLIYTLVCVAASLALARRAVKAGRERGQRSTAARWRRVLPAVVFGAGFLALFRSIM
jgi:hypothetical protein